MATSAVHRALNTTELLEIILLEDAIDLHQLFACQRVNKKFGAVMQGSEKLRIKMCLQHSDKDLAPQEGREEEWLRDGKTVRDFLNPLLGHVKRFVVYTWTQRGAEEVYFLDMEDRRSSVFVAIEPKIAPESALFNDVLLEFWRKDGRLRVAFSVSDVARMKFRSRPGGSWRKMMLTRTPAVAAAEGSEAHQRAKVTLGQFADMLVERSAPGEAPFHHRERVEDVWQ